MTYYQLKFGTFAVIMSISVAWAKFHPPFWAVFYLCAIIGIGIGAIHLLYPQTKYKNYVADYVPTENVEESLHKAYISNLSGPEFEDIVLDLFHRSGYNANKTRQNYPGIDIIARKIDKTTGEITEKIVVQCKRFSDLVGKTNVEQFYYRCLKESPETKKMMFASSGFSRPAWEFAQNHDIQLIDGEAIRKFA